MTNWGTYVNVLVHEMIGYGHYVGSATGVNGFRGRLLIYNAPPGKLPIFHQELMWTPGWASSLHQLSDSSKLPNRHRCYAIFTEAFGMVLTDSFDTTTIASHWNAKFTGEFVRKFQLAHDIPVHDRLVRVNRALPTKQPMRIDARFKNLICVCCNSDKGPHYSATSGQLFDLGNRLCRKCWDFKDEYGSDRPAEYLARYPLWKNNDKLNCDICNDLFTTTPSVNTTKGIRLYLTDLQLAVCRWCDHYWKQKHLMLPIHNLHIPYDHHWACDQCQTTSSRWFQFTAQCGHIGKYYCYSCCLGDEARFLSKEKAKMFVTHAIMDAGFPSPATLREVRRSGQRANDFYQGLVHYVKKHFNIDLTSFKSICEQRKIDIASTGEVIPEFLAADTLLEPLMIRKEAAHLDNGMKHKEYNKSKKRRRDSVEAEDLR
ncbi:hypothetical protein H2198_003779 [Neophaeococcomyces mojaviensis]|uniref:Uncharacterized protein n=1 Tax=Neophaeococcomyces mojaviensis TaxID=3383035 RepID=A0ACC3AAU1_9EURO|nr:hypothetical protein H2198_003779 [Knufia sp. JES_112]